MKKMLFKDELATLSKQAKNYLNIHGDTFKTKLAIDLFFKSLMKDFDKWETEPFVGKETNAIFFGVNRTGKGKNTQYHFQVAKEGKEKLFGVDDCNTKELVAYCAFISNGVKMKQRG